MFVTRFAARAALFCVALAPVTGLGADPGGPPGEPVEAPAPPAITSARDAERLRQLEGLTLQWIDWDQRGRARAVVDEAGVWRLSGEQVGEGGAVLAIDGTITAIGPDHFEMTGAVTILNTPDEGRTCEGYGEWRFEVTQGRSYYRLRRFGWCDDLTDYVDLYFPPTLR